MNTDYIRDFWIEHDYFRLKKYPNNLHFLAFTREAYTDSMLLEYLKNLTNKKVFNDTFNENIDDDVKENAKFKPFSNFSRVFHSEMGLNERIASYKEGNSPKSGYLYENKTHIEKFNSNYADKKLKIYNEKKDDTNRKAINNVDFNGKKYNINEFFNKMKDSPEKKVSASKEINDEKEVLNKTNEEKEVLNAKETNKEKEIPKEINEEKEITKEINEEIDISYAEEINEIILMNQNTYEVTFNYNTIEHQIKEFIKILLMDSINDHCFSILLTAFEKIAETNIKWISDIDFVNNYFYKFEEQSVGSDSQSSSKIMYRFTEILSIFIKLNQLSSIDLNKILY